MTQSWDSYMGLQEEDLPTEVTDDSETIHPPIEQLPDDSLAELASSLHLPATFVQEIDRLIEDKGQVVFTGPPGTGKTFIARKLAKHYTQGDDTRMEFLQFHPSYAYEDFVEGFRPRLEDDSANLSFSVEPGPLMVFVRRAQIALDNFGEDAPIHVMVIDELNRANLGRVFGELFFALEYRGQSVRLQYSPDKPMLRLPSNLWFIGTMNTADRSIALFDAALRRRFYFIDCSPNHSPFDGVLNSFLTQLHFQGGPNLEWLDTLLRHVNETIPDPRYAVGPSYFMRPDLTVELAERAWKYTVLPYLADRFEGLVASGIFDWSALLEKFAPSSPTDILTVNMQDHAQDDAPMQVDPLTGVSGGAGGTAGEQ